MLLSGWAGESGAPPVLSSSWYNFMKCAKKPKAVLAKKREWFCKYFNRQTRKAREGIGGQGEAGGKEGEGYDGGGTWVVGTDKPQNTLMSPSCRVPVNLALPRKQVIHAYIQPHASTHPYHLSIHPPTHQPPAPPIDPSIHQPTHHPLMHPPSRLQKHLHNTSPHPTPAPPPSSLPPQK